MGKASRTKQSTSRQERIAAQRAAARKAEQRKRIFMAVGSVLAVLVVVAVFIIVKTTGGNSGTSASGLTGSPLTSTVSEVTSVPASTLGSVGAGGGAVTGKIQTVQGTSTALTENGKPEILYMGAEYCPYCAAERWSMIIALSRFGTFSGLKTMQSSSSDVYPSTPTWTFVDAKYSSSYLSFTSVEMQDRKKNTLQTPTTAENATLTKYDTAPYVAASSAGSIPFIDFGNKYLIIGASYTPQTIDGLTWSQIAADLTKPSSAVAKAVDGTANYITAALCQLTGNQPANVCTTTIKSLESQI
jgi:hypothetical protein